MKRYILFLCITFMLIGCNTALCEGDIPFTHVSWDDYNTVTEFFFDIPNRDYKNMKPCIGKEIRVYGYCKDTSVISDSFILTDSNTGVKIFTNGIDIPNDRSHLWYVVGVVDAVKVKADIPDECITPSNKYTYRYFSIHATYIDTIPDR